jgi:hypothetical protein
MTSADVLDRCLQHEAARLFFFTIDGPAEFSKAEKADQREPSVTPCSTRVTRITQKVRKTRKVPLRKGLAVGENCRAARERRGE